MTEASRQPGSGQYFLDSNFIIALIDSSDVHHSRAATLLEEIQKEPAEIFLSDLAVNEVLTVLARRCETKGRKEEFRLIAASFQEFIKGLPILCLYELLPRAYSRIFSLMVRHEGTMSFHDCLILIFLEQVPEVHLVTFDGDFLEIKEIKVVPKKS